MKSIYIVSVMFIIVIVSLAFFLGVIFTGLFTAQPSVVKSQNQTQTYITSEESAVEAIQNISEGLDEIKSGIENLEQILP